MSLLRQTTSRKGREFLAREEGEVRYAYADPAGWATFGVGHLIEPQHKGVTAQDARKWGTKAHPHSHRMVMRVFRRDLKKYEAAVRQSVGRRLRRRQFDAAVSLCFNVGINGFKTSSVARILRTRPAGVRAKEAADAFLLWDQPSVLRPRRKRERELFLHGRYSS